MFFEKIKLEDDEKIHAVVRRHWFFLLKQVSYIFVLILAPLFGFVVMFFTSPEIIDPFMAVYTPHVLFLYAFWLLINWMLLASLWTDHYLDVWVITSRRIVNINQVGFFRRQIASFKLDRLQDITVEINGIIETLLDFGTIHAETASGKDEEFKASHLPHPRELKSLILQASEDHAKTHLQ